MSSRHYLGEFEHIVVLALMHLGDRAYGVTVRQEIAERTERDVSLGAIYATPDRMEAKGYVTSRLGEPTAERGGRSKRFFRVTTKGVTAVNRTHRALLSMSAGLSKKGIPWYTEFQDKDKTEGLSAIGVSTTAGNLSSHCCKNTRSIIRS